MCGEGLAEAASGGVVEEAPAGLLGVVVRPIGEGVVLVVRAAAAGIGFEEIFQHVLNLSHVGIFEGVDEHLLFARTAVIELGDDFADLLQGVLRARDDDRLRAGIGYGRDGCRTAAPCGTPIAAVAAPVA